MPAVPAAPTTPLNRLPLNLAAMRAIASIPGAELPPDMLAAMRSVLVTEGNGKLVRELEWLFDLETGRARTL
jgi:hypothetical protein